MSLDRDPPRTPRLNMALELGLAVAKRIKREYANDLFETRPFADLAYVANDAAHRHIPSLSP